MTKKILFHASLSALKYIIITANSIIYKQLLIICYLILYPSIMKMLFNINPNKKLMIIKFLSFELFVIFLVKNLIKTRANNIKYDMISIDAYI